MTSSLPYRQPWVGKPWIEIIFILLPPFASLLFIFLFPSMFRDNKDIPDTWWVILILLIDVAHVYSTLYRTYFDRQIFHQQKGLLFGIPFIAFIAGVVFYSISSILFWRLLAYVAVFHFVRQQYGFLRVYSRKEEKNNWYNRIDSLTIYAATVYPLLYWHFSDNRNFNWFTEGDFVNVKSATLLAVATTLYWLTIALYLVKEVVFCFSTRSINLPRITVIAGTALSWYFGIVYFNGDMAFTLLNVVSHGVPYMALIWLYGKKNYTLPTSKAGGFLRLVFSQYGVLLFVGIIFLLAYVEEGLWDIAVWKERANVFAAFHFIKVNVSDKMLAFIVPLLALPQITHYVIDGYIWRIRKDNFKWNSEAKD
ncbi:hypothetical protein [Foetidibacter luteolus]|uniref:hypothetical protein n=1 Tax=Foetidibacter luteolus TaxID=2608880 RepID=UPI00129C0560|nr:hypothetical protein [Foetidibacter luteolus]